MEPTIYLWGNELPVRNNKSWLGGYSSKRKPSEFLFYTPEESVLLRPREGKRMTERKEMKIN